MKTLKILVAMLSGLLAFNAANAGELTVSGSMQATYSEAIDKDTGNPLGLNTDLVFSGSTEILDGNTVTMTDNDLAGRELGYSIANKLRNKDILWASYEYGKIYPHDAKDAGDMTEEEIKACIKNAVSDIEYRSWNP